MITYTISVCDELNTLKKSLENITGSLISGESLLIQFDSNNGSNDVKLFLDNCNLDYITYEFTGDYASMKNNLLNNINTQWVFHLDGDEYIDKNCLEINRELISKYNKVIDGFVIKRNDFNIDTNETEQIDWQLRFFKNRKWIKWEGLIHEGIVGVDKIMNINYYQINHLRTTQEIIDSRNL